MTLGIVALLRPLRVLRIKRGLVPLAVRPWIVDNLHMSAILLPYRQAPTSRLQVHVARPVTLELHLPSVARALAVGRLLPGVHE